MVFFVRDLESYLTAAQVVKMGAGILPRPQSANGVVAALTHVLQESSYKTAAANFAQSKISKSLSSAVKNVTNEIVRAVFARDATQLVSEVLG